MSLAIAGNLLISVAFNITKHAHNLNAARAVPLPYVRVPLWWCGFATTLVGELGNFAAYGFAEASVIVPLGATTVLANAFIAALVLGEGLRHSSGQDVGGRLNVRIDHSSGQLPEGHERGGLLALKRGNLRFI